MATKAADKLGPGHVQPLVMSGEHFANPRQLYLVVGLAIHELEAATMAKQRADVVTGANTKGPREQSRSP